MAQEEEKKSETKQETKTDPEEKKGRGDTHNGPLFPPS